MQLFSLRHSDTKTVGLATKPEDYVSIYTPPKIIIMAQSNYRKLQRELYEAYKAELKARGRGNEIISFGKWQKAIDGITNLTPGSDGR